MEMGRKNKKHRSLAHFIEKEGDPLGRLLNYGLKNEIARRLVICVVLRNDYFINFFAASRAAS